MSTPTPRTNSFISKLLRRLAEDHGFSITDAVECARSFQAEMETELTAALARIGELERDRDELDNQLCDARSGWESAESRITDFARRLSEAQESLKLSQHDAAQERLRIVKLEGLLSESQSQLAKERAYRDSEIDRIHSELASERQKNEQMKAQLASAREDSERLDWLESRHFECDGHHGFSQIVFTEYSAQSDLRSAIDTARGVSGHTETPPSEAPVPASMELSEEAMRTLKLFRAEGRASISLAQRRFLWGYLQAARAVEELQDAGLVSRANTTSGCVNLELIPPPPTGKEKQE